MSLTQFGSIMTFAINLENQLAKFYDEVAETGGIHAEEFSRRANACRKRKRKLERSRRENITEMTLEPIAGLNADNYALDLANDSLTSINAIEKIVIRFYTDVAPKINVLESRRILERCKKEHSNLSELN
ncbi:MAG: hypothetical protein ACFFBD_14265 [Candidatus Hodarchaeota archaeon]